MFSFNKLRFLLSPFVSVSVINRRCLVRGIATILEQIVRAKEFNVPKVLRCKGTWNRYASRHISTYLWSIATCVYTYICSHSTKILRRLSWKRTSLKGIYDEAIDVLKLPG